MSKPKLLIGIGTSGLRVLEHVQHFYYENTGRNKPDNVEYMYIETDENAYPGVTAISNEIKRIYISLSERETMINGLRNSKMIDGYWLPPASSIMDSGFGAGGLPAFGRVALWGHQNFERVSQAISSAYTRVANYDVEESDDSKPAVFITGSLTGGTGAGIFIDLAYMVRHIISDISEVYGLFLIPGKQSYNGNEIIYCNTLAALKALEFYMDKKNTYKMRWPNGYFTNFVEPPYELVQILSQEYTGNIPPIQKLQGLYKIAGLYLFLNIFGLRGKRLSRLGDAKASAYIDKYGTFGISAIQYPKTQLEEYLSILKSRELFRRWTNPEFFYSQGQREEIKTRSTTIHNKTLVMFEKFLREAFDVLNAAQVAEGRDIRQDLRIQAEKINRHEYDTPTDYDYIYQLFAAGGAANYYSGVKSYLNQAKDTIIKRIYETVTQSVDQYENLYVAKIQLEAFIKAIDSCLNYWQSIRLSSQTAKWDAILNQQINWMLKGRYKLLLEQDNVLEDRLFQTLELLKMHILIEPLVTIRNDIVGGKYAVTTRSFNENFELPTIKQIDEIITIIIKTIGTEDADRNDYKYKTLRLRKSEIEDEINDKTIPILRIFPSGSFTKEIEHSLHKYHQSKGSSVPSKKIFLNEKSLWLYLTHTSREILSKQLYNDYISSFEQDIRRAGCVDDLDVGDYIEKQSEEAKKIATRATFPLVRINSDKSTLFQDAGKIPKLVIAQDHPTIKKVIKTFYRLNFHEFNDEEDGSFAKEDLKNIIVFYAEKGYMSDKSNFDPLRHIRYIDEVETIYKEFPKQKNISEQEWHILRNPYIPFKKSEV